GWTYTWTQLSRSGNWSVKEVDVPDGYESSVRNSGTTIVVTNTYEEVIEETTPPGITTTPGITPPGGEGGGDIDLFDEDVPLADVPATGDNTVYYALVALVSGVSLLWLNLTGRKNENEQ
ncbi:MAG: Cna B-type domain-containing protein, partial [Firmicutes bacterium]|nr:Cna B-type domain-containing protein [Bacillota bacterium]